MEWLKSLQGTTVAIDTTIFIYFAEEAPPFIRQAAALFEALDRQEFKAVTSTITLTEVLTLPLRQGRGSLAERYRQLLQTSVGLALVPVTDEVAEIAASVRARSGFRTPDAIQIATALHAGAAHFITNDTRLATATGVRVRILERLP